MGQLRPRSATRSSADADDAIIDLRSGEARYFRAQPASPYGYDPVIPNSWTPTDSDAPYVSLERPTESTVGSLPRRFRIEGRFPPMQRTIHHGPILGHDVEVKLTVSQSIRLHTTGIERPMIDLEGRVRDKDMMRLLVDAFGRDRRALGARNSSVPRTLVGAKKEWHREIRNRGRHGFALSDEHLVLLEYVSPERDPRRRNFGIAYKRVVMAYQIALG